MIINFDPALIEEFGLTKELVQNLKGWVSENQGIIIASGKHSESKDILTKLAPEWAHLSQVEFKDNAKIDKAFIYLSDLDPISLFTSFIELSTEIESREKIAKRIKGIVSLIPLKKQCGTCAKPTPIPQTSRGLFPKFIVESVPTSYLFSRGCERCEYRSYIGITFLESFICNLSDILSYEARNLNPESIFLKSRESGMKIFFESGLEKIKLGLTSLEQVAEHTPPLEQAFDELLNNTALTHNIRQDSQTSSSTSTKSILIVEDDTDQREILKLVFTKEGFDVSTAENGQEALDFLKTKSVQVILSDIMMPIMNGLQLVRALKNSEQLKNIPVLMLTASSNPDHEVKLLEGGADDYCAKNVKKKVLLTRVEKLIEKAKPNRTTLDHFLT